MGEIGRLSIIMLWEAVFSEAERCLMTSAIICGNDMLFSGENGMEILCGAQRAIVRVVCVEDGG